MIVFAFSIAKANTSAPEQEDISTLLLEVSIGDTVLLSASGDTTTFQINKKDEILLTASPLKEIQKKKKLVTAILAFPFPFGFVAAHRVMLGTKPWIPIVYVATFGGCFGLLPLVDFCVIICSKNIEQYENNPNLFMWIK